MIKVQCNKIARLTLKVLFYLNLSLYFISCHEIFTICNVMIFSSFGIIVPVVFVYMYCRLPLSEDPALAMAFSVARRAAAVPLLLVNGTYRKTIRTYLDSSILQYQLQRLDHSLKGFGPRLIFICMYVCGCACMHVCVYISNWIHDFDCKSFQTSVHILKHIFKA